MYFKYIWNNFLHIQVEICTAMILAMPPAPTDTQSDKEQENARESILIKHVRLECYCNYHKCYSIVTFVCKQSYFLHG